MNVALSSAELADFMSAPNPFVGQVMWVVQLKPVASPPIEAAFPNAFVEHPNSLHYLYIPLIPHIDPKTQVYGVDWLAFREQPNLGDLIQSGVPWSAIEAIIDFILEPQTKAESDFRGESELPDYSRKTLEKFLVRPQVVQCLYDFFMIPKTTRKFYKQL